MKSVLSVLKSLKLFYFAIKDQTLCHIYIPEKKPPPLPTPRETAKASMSKRKDPKGHLLPIRGFLEPAH